MIVDCHAHLEPRMLDVDRMLAKMDGAGVDRVALIPTMNDPLPRTPERLLATVRALMRRGPTRPLAGAIARAVMNAEGDLVLDGKVFQIYERPDNAAVARVLETHPRRFIGWIFLNPRGNPGVLDELERWRTVAGFVGVKLHPHWHRYRTAILDPLLARCEELGLPVLVHLGFGARGDYRGMAERFSRLRMVCAHAGMPYFAKLWGYARGRRNLWVDLSSPYLDERLVREAVAAMGPERCLYGTDAPYGFHEADESYDYRRIRGWVEGLAVAEGAREGILGGNFVEVIGRDLPG